MTKMKKCIKCEVEKPATLEFFYKRVRAKDGLCGSCKICEAARTKARYYKDHERSKEMQRIGYRKAKERFSERFPHLV